MSVKLPVYVFGSDFLQVYTAFNTFMILRYDLLEENLNFWKLCP